MCSETLQSVKSDADTASSGVKSPTNMTSARIQSWSKLRTQTIDSGKRAEIPAVFLWVRGEVESKATDLILPNPVEAYQEHRKDVVQVLGLIRPS